MDSTDGVSRADNLDQNVSSLVSASYQPLPLDLKEQWRILEEAQSVPFSKWDLQATLAWFEVGLGESQYTIMVLRFSNYANSFLNTDLLL